MEPQQITHEEIQSLIDQRNNALHRVAQIDKQLAAAGITLRKVPGGTYYERSDAPVEPGEEINHAKWLTTPPFAGDSVQVIWGWPSGNQTNLPSGEKTDEAAVAALDGNKCNRG